MPWPFRSKLPELVFCGILPGRSGEHSWLVGWMGYEHSAQQEPKRIGDSHTFPAATVTEAVDRAGREIAALFASEPLAASSATVRFDVHPPPLKHPEDAYTVVFDVRREGADFLTTRAWRMDTKAAVSDLLGPEGEIRAGSLDEFVTKIATASPPSVRPLLRWTQRVTELP
jgi:hypothetical protein